MWVQGLPHTLNTPWAFWLPGLSPEMSLLHCTESLPSSPSIWPALVPALVPSPALLAGWGISLASLLAEVHRTGHSPWAGGPWTLESQPTALPALGTSPGATRARVQSQTVPGDTACLVDARGAHGGQSLKQLLCVQPLGRGPGSVVGGIRSSQHPTGERPWSESHITVSSLLISLCLSSLSCKMQKRLVPTSWHVVRGPCLAFSQHS